MPQLRLRATGPVLDILWLQTRKHDVITLLIKSMGSHINPSECTVCIVHLCKSPIFPVKHGIMYDKLCKVIYSWSVSGKTLQCREHVQSALTHTLILLFFLNKQELWIVLGFFLLNINIFM